MCYAPRVYPNPRYKGLNRHEAVDAYNRHFASVAEGLVYDGRWPPDYYIQVPCGRCPDCLKRQRSEITFRLKQELLSYPVGQFEHVFVTLTFDEPSIQKYKSDYRVCVRRFIDNVRKKYGFQPRFWFLSELGEKKHRFHFHGLLFGFPKGVLKWLYDPVKHKYYTEDLKPRWHYGWSFFGQCDFSSCGYITKYMTKQQFSPDYDYKPVKILSKGLGRDNVDHVRDMVKRFDDQQVPNLMYDDGSKYRYIIPRYFREKIYTEDDLIFAQYVRISSPFLRLFNGVYYDDPFEYKKALNSYYEHIKRSDYDYSDKQPIYKRHRRSSLEVAQAIFKPDSSFDCSAGSFVFDPLFTGVLSDDMLIDYGVEYACGNCSFETYFHWKNGTTPF